MISRSSMKKNLPATLSLVAVSGLAFALASGCAQSEAAPNPEKAAPPTESVAADSKAKAPEYTVEMRKVGTYKAKTEGKVELVVTPDGGYKVNKQYPMKFKVKEPSEGITFAKNIVKEGDGGSITEKEGKLVFSFTPAAPGKAKVSGVLSFSVCSYKNCLMEKKELELAVDVQ